MTATRENNNGGLTDISRPGLISGTTDFWDKKAEKCEKMPNVMVRLREYVERLLHFA